MNIVTAVRHGAAWVVCGLASSVIVGLAPGVADASPIFSAAAAHAGSARTAPYRQLIGEVSQSTYLEASVPATGSYAIEYVVTGTAYFDTYVNGNELGYVGGSAGVYRTRASRLPAGGVLIQVVGPEGSGRAKVYLVRVS